MNDDFILVSDKLPPHFLLVYIRDIKGTTVNGWHTSTDWEFSTKEIVPYSWKKYKQRVVLSR